MLISHRRGPANLVHCQSDNSQIKVLPGLIRQPKGALQLLALDFRKSAPRRAQRTNHSNRKLPVLPVGWLPPAADATLDSKVAGQNRTPPRTAPRTNRRPP